MSALEELKTLLDGSQGEALDVPHPNQIKNTVMTPLTKWHRSELPSDFELNQLGAPEFDMETGKPKTFVSGQIVRTEKFDDYNEPIGEIEYAVLHKVNNPKLNFKDTSSTRVHPFTVKDMRRRFPAAFAEFEDKLKASGTPLPIALLDTVPPFVVQLLFVRGAKTIEDFAAYTKKQIEDLKTDLKAKKMDARVAYVERYRDQARAKVGIAVQEAA